MSYKQAMKLSLCQPCTVARAASDEHTDLTSAARRLRQLFSMDEKKVSVRFHGCVAAGRQNTQIGIARAHSMISCENSCRGVPSHKKSCDLRSLKSPRSRHHIDVKAAMQNIKYKIQLNQSARLNEKRCCSTFTDSHLSCLWMWTFSLIFSTSPFFSL
jgi:hypothetical protein